MRRLTRTSLPTLLNLQSTYRKVFYKLIVCLNLQHIALTKMVDGTIPVVDFGIMGLKSESPPSHNEEAVKKLAEEIHTAFSTIGFVYLKNHGISDAEVRNRTRLNNAKFGLLIITIMLVKLIAKR